MVDPVLIEQLDRAIDAALSGGANDRLLTELQRLPDERFKLRLKAELERSASMSTTYTPVREGFRMVTPYISVADGEAMIAFLKATFDATEVIRHIPGPGRLHAEVRIGDSMLMIGSGPQVTDPRLVSLHVYVDDPDAAFARALKAGAKSMGEPVDRPYGERSGFVEDAQGNVYFIAKRFPSHPGPEGAGSVLPFLFPKQAHSYIEFLERAFGARRMEVYEHEGRVVHAGVRIGDAIVELGEAHESVPTRSAFMLYVPDVDAFYERAVAAGATPIRAPQDQPYGHRDAALSDPAGYVWYPASLL